MSRIKRPSPALVISIMALIAAIAVPAFALTKGEKRVVKKIAAGQVKKLAPGLAVASAKTAADTAEVHSPARLVLNDPTPGDFVAQSTTVLAAGAFTVRAECWDNFAGTTDDAVIRLHGPAGTSFSGRRSDVFDNQPGATVRDLAQISTLGSNQARSGDMIAVAPNGQVISVTGSAEVGDPTGDCVFGVTATGP